MGDTDEALGEHEYGAVRADGRDDGVQGTRRLAVQALSERELPCSDPFSLYAEPGCPFA